jgi:hypothetical protein
LVLKVGLTLRIPCILSLLLEYWSCHKQWNFWVTDNVL